jgi:DNA polymerase-3 subunit gamma/tau
MGYLALARKYRPQDFNGIVGQEFVVKTLKNAIELGRVSHAYIFTGPRGVGKTSIARIFAKAINCLNPDGMNPCGKCDNCIEITEGTSIDVVEIDGASNRGIDEIRQLRESVKFVPIKSTYKVYILDEVHMLTDAAFNALLKTLEEPPAHAIFIMATTEIQKIPATILSRSQKYNFNRIPFDYMKEYLIEVLQKEQIEFEDDAVNIIIRNSDGCMRDALSLIDQIIAFSEGKLLVENTRYLLGATDSSLTENLLVAILNENIDEIPDIIEEISIKGIEYKYIVESLISHIRHLLYAVVTKKITSKTLTEEEINFYNSLLPELDENRLFALFQILQKLHNDLKTFSFERYIFEFGIFKCATVSKILPVNSLNIVSGNNKQTDIKPKENSKSEVTPSDLNESDKTWENFLSTIVSPSISANLGHGYISELTDNLLVIGYAEDKVWHYNFVNKPENKNVIINAAKDYFKGISEVKILIEEKGKKKTIVEKKKDLETFREKKIKKEVLEDKMINKIKEVFGGTIENIEVLPDDRIKEE